MRHWERPVGLTACSAGSAGGLQMSMWDLSSVRLPAPGREAENWLSAREEFGGRGRERLVGLMVVRERERWKVGVKGGEGLCWAAGEEGGHGESGCPEAAAQLPGPGLSGAGWGDGVRCCVGLPAGCPSLSAASPSLPWDSDQESPRL